MKNDDTDNKFDWGESARVKSKAPLIFRPGQVVSVCGMTKIKSRILADKYNCNMEEWVYTIEYLGGADIEIPERYLEKYSDDSNIDEIPPASLR
ncbi:MAG: hypothetical protein V4487_02530 [Chlamydiota bacterium]